LDLIAHSKGPQKIKSCCLPGLESLAQVLVKLGLIWDYLNGFNVDSVEAKAGDYLTAYWTHEQQQSAENWENFRVTRENFTNELMLQWTETEFKSAIKKKVRYLTMKLLPALTWIW
jgi:hypothetical protein